MKFSGLKNDLFDLISLLPFLILTGQEIFYYSYQSQPEEGAGPGANQPMWGPAAALIPHAPDSNKLPPPSAVLVAVVVVGGGGRG